MKEGWSTIPLGSACINTEQRDPRDEPSRLIRYVDLSGVDRDSKLITKPTDIVGADAPSRARKVIRTQDVLVSTVRPNLNAVAQVPKDLDGEIASTGFCIIRADRKRAHPRFLFYRVQCSDFVQFLVDRVTGANYPAVSDAIVKNAPLPVPPLPEQHRIVRLLDEADEMRRRREQADRRTADLIPALFYEMFGDPLSIPQRWPTRSVGEISTFITSGSRGWAKYYSNTGARFIRVQNLTGNQLNVDDIVYVSPVDDAESKRTKIYQNDLLLSITGATIGLVAVAPSGLGQAHVSQHVALIRLHPECVPEYVALCLADPRIGQRQIAEFQYGGTKPGLNLTQVRELHFPYPSHDLQCQFAARVAEIRALQARQGQSRRRLDDLFQSMLHRAFQGEL